MPAILLVVFCIALAHLNKKKIDKITKSLLLWGFSLAVLRGHIDLPGCVLEVSQPELWISTSHLISGFLVSCSYRRHQYARLWLPEGTSGFYSEQR